MKNIISDKKLLNLTKKFIFDEDKVGIPIGNYTSQYFANIYLDVLDHYVKEALKVKYYVRYVEDFVILTKNKEEAKHLKAKIEIFLKNRLSLELNKKSEYYPNKLGIDFCGYIIYETHRLLGKSAKKKINKKVDLWNKLNSMDKLNKNKMLLEWNGFKAHSSHANSYKFNLKVYNKIVGQDVLSKSKAN